MAKVNPYQKLAAILVGSATVKYGREVYASWSADSGISEGVIRRRIKSPETMQLGELRSMARAVQVSADEILGVLPL